jgi:hypothetical protein
LSVTAGSLRSTLQFFPKTPVHPHVHGHAGSNSGNSGVPTASASARHRFLAAAIEPVRLPGCPAVARRAPTGGHLGDQPPSHDDESHRVLEDCEKNDVSSALLTSLTGSEHVIPIKLDAGLRGPVRRWHASRVPDADPAVTCVRRKAGFPRLRPAGTWACSQHGSRRAACWDVDGDHGHHSFSNGWRGAAHALVVALSSSFLARLFCAGPALVRGPSESRPVW